MSQANCFHGGAFWAAIGDDFHDLSRRHRVVNADVLDAWFPPAPSVVEAVQGSLEWLTRTSPPTHAEGLREVLAQVLGIGSDGILVGAGSSALIYQMYREWLNAGDGVLVVDPMYGEYAHLAHVSGAQLTSLPLNPPEFLLDLEEWIAAVRKYRPALAVLVNPNNPTGQTIPRDRLMSALRRVPSETRVLVDEAYAPYVPGAALDVRDGLAPNIFVLRSLSKSHALSGLRVAYLVGDPLEIQRLRRWSPPWAVSGVGQLAAIRALGEEVYYERCRAETCRLRRRLLAEVASLGLQDVCGEANWVLLKLPDEAAPASDWVQAAAQDQIFLRDAGKTSAILKGRYLRIAVRSSPENGRVVDVLRRLSAHEKYWGKT